LRLDTLSTDRSAPCDLIILDVVMPETSGIDACARIRSHPNFFDVPVLMLTAVDDSEGLARAFAAGATDYVTKPFNPVELAARVGAALKTKAELDRRRTRENELIAEAEGSPGKDNSVRWIDATTGLFVGEAAEAYLSASCAHSPDRPVSVLALAIDGHAEIEAEVGEDACERLLVRAADELRAVAANIDTIAAAYLDGVIVLVAPSLLSHQVRQFGDSVHGAIARAHIAGAPSGREITVSIGGITARPGQAAGSQLIESARSVLRTAMAGGGNRVLTVDLSCT
jgi:PleD family two-component response regulator